MRIPPDGSVMNPRKPGSARQRAGNAVRIGRKLIHRTMRTIESGIVFPASQRVW